MNLNVTINLCSADVSRSKLSSLIVSSSNKSNKITNEEKIVKLMREKPKRCLKNIEEEISKLSDVNSFFKEDGKGEHFNLLFHASQENCLDAFLFLLSRGADPSLKNNKGMSVLHLTAKNGQVFMGMKCLANLPWRQPISVFINGCSESGWTPLMAAAENNQLQFVRWLLSEKVAVNATMKTGWTAMHAASKKNNWEIVKLLLENGGDKNILASHRKFGKGLKVEDVTTDEKTRSILQQWE